MSKTSDNDDTDVVSDVGSLISVPAGLDAAHSDAPRASPRAQPPNALPLHAVLGGVAIGGAVPPVRRNIAQRRVGEISGEGSQSEGLDSPTWVNVHNFDDC